MRIASLTQLSDAELLRRLTVLVQRERTNTAWLLAHIAEVDGRRLYLPAGHSSMHAYCVEVLHLSDDAAYKRIQAARAARQFPQLFAAVADGRLHLSAVCMLATHLADENIGELIAAATHRRKHEIERWLEVRFAPPLLVAAVAAVAAAEAPATPELAPGQVAAAADAVPAGQVAPGARELAPAPSLSPLAPHVVLRVALAPATHDKLRRAQELLSHAVPAGDVAQVLDRALDLLIAQVERRKLAATPAPRAARPPRRPAATRTIPAQVKRAVRRRDGDRCAFVAADGWRCSARRRLEFDHVQPLARGGHANVDGVRLLCRAHNQFEAERLYGREFMRAKREERRKHRASDVASDLAGARSRSAGVNLPRGK